MTASRQLRQEEGMRLIRQEGMQLIRKTTVVENRLQLQEIFETDFMQKMVDETFEILEKKNH